MYNNKVYKISEDIYNAVKDKVIIKELSGDMCDRVLKKTLEMYAYIKMTDGFLWEGLRDCETFSDIDGWLYIQKFVLDNSCIMFFNPYQEKKMFNISSGKDLQYILSETCPYEFYVTDMDYSYLLCFTHHDVLIGCGKAKEWVRNLKMTKG